MTATPPTTEMTVERRSGFDRRVAEAAGGPLRGATPSTFQVNIGRTCNLACRRCHVESSPKRPEQMDWPTAKTVLDAAMRAGAQTIDLTGGAPEMNPHFRRFVEEALARRFHVMVRTNMPIGRFLHDLRRAGRAEHYMHRLRAAFNPATVEPLMCRHPVHVAWDGALT